MKHLTLGNTVTDPLALPPSFRTAEPELAEGVVIVGVRMSFRSLFALAMKVILAYLLALLLVSLVAGLIVLLMRSLAPAS